MISKEAGASWNLISQLGSETEHRMSESLQTSPAAFDNLPLVCFRSEDALRAIKSVGKDRVAFQRQIKCWARHAVDPYAQQQGAQRKTHERTGNGCFLELVKAT